MLHVICKICVHRSTAILTLWLNRIISYLAGPSKNSYWHFLNWRFLYQPSSRVKVEVAITNSSCDLNNNNGSSVSSVEILQPRLSWNYSGTLWLVLWLKSWSIKILPTCVNISNCPRSDVALSYSFLLLQIKFPLLFQVNAEPSFNGNDYKIVGDKEIFDGDEVLASKTKVRCLRQRSSPSLPSRFTWLEMRELL